jgi:hypothetical protein
MKNVYISAYEHKYLQRTHMKNIYILLELQLATFAWKQWTLKEEKHVISIFWVKE